MRVTYSYQYLDGHNKWDMGDKQISVEMEILVITYRQAFLYIQETDQQ